MKIGEFNVEKPLPGWICANLRNQFNILMKSLEKSLRLVCLFTNTIEGHYMGQTIIVSNRLPVKLTDNNGELSFSQSEGGLATGLGSIYKQGNNVWIGWPGMDIDDPDQQREIHDALADENLKPVFLTQEEIN